MTHGAGAIRALLDAHGIEPSRALGQNFVIDPNTVRRIAPLAGAAEGDHVLEIGPGLGSLTLALAELGHHVTAIEADRHLLPALAEVTAEADITVVHADALEVDYDTVLAGAERWRLAANLPYNVGSQILLRLLELAPSVTGGVILVQREVADRLTATPGTKTYGIPTVKASWWAEMVPAGRVAASVFHPRPRVESALVQFERRSEPGDEALRRRVFSLIDAGFGQRRKMVRRSLAAECSVDDLTAAGIDPTSRAEALVLDDWCRLAHVLADQETA